MSTPPPNENLRERQVEIENEDWRSKYCVAADMRDQWERQAFSMQAERDELRHRAAPGSALDARELGVIRGLIITLAAFTYATTELVLKALTGVLFTAAEAQDILGPNDLAQAAPTLKMANPDKTPTADSGRLPAAHGSPVPKWYDVQEIRHYLKRQNYSDGIADELSADYATNLQKAFNKGYELGRRGQSTPSPAHESASPVSAIDLPDEAFVSTLGCR